jgi:predicted amidohydrolase YtcJ
MNTRLIRVAAVTLWLAAGIARAAEPAADLVVVGAAIATLDPARPEAAALAVRGDRIVAVGSDAEIAPFVGPGTRRLEAGGRRVVPGFIEGHGHFMSLGESLGTLDLRGAERWEDIVAQVKAAAATAAPGVWIVGRGWHQEKWRGLPADAVGGVPTNAALNAVAPRNPVALEHASGHGVIVNAAALALADIDAKAADPTGGQIVRDVQGTPTGWLVDTAADPVYAAQQRALAALPVAEQRRLRVEQVRRAGQEALAKGVTTFHDAGASFATIDLYRELAEAGELPIRLYAMVGGESNERLARDLPRYRLVGHANHFLTVRAIKRMVDGALGSRSAWLLEPYADAPDSTGLVVDSLETIARTAELAAANGYQLNRHAIGDRANREILDLYERALRGRDGRALRWRIEHAQHLHPTDVPRFAKLGVIAAMQGVHASSDGPWVPKRLGEPRAGERTYVWRSLIDSGALVGNGTDVPVEDIDPLACFRASVTREMVNGQRFHPEQNMTRQEALASYTWNNAYAGFEEDLKGSLAPGKLADFVVLDRDILRVPDAELASAHVLHTVLAGRVVYSRAPKAP